MTHSTRPNLGLFVFLGIAITLSLYFMFAAVQGDYGVFKRAEIDAEAVELAKELEGLTAQIAVLENKTRRLSYDYLDLDLLDEQARDVLGMVRVDEVVVQ
ncbi:FtsB family cell division protein [Shimia ponticola]|uniref:FtsB family cell division protein n=1 Tax=Shimia ponticola TaxID=2582893 RepID=UPI0011BEDE11|nr:septum formation initiator family protein [Shimia ponticola]